MNSETYRAMLSGKSVIRELSERATALKAEIGEENVFDYSLGNPSVPVPQAFNTISAFFDTDFDAFDALSLIPL